ncbi:Protein of unknown function [Gryllus bimaculatus]|nr:Protein of unknown function [Gryllus bimaculatus]
MPKQVTILPVLRDDRVSMFHESVCVPESCFCALLLQSQPLAAFSMRRSSLPPPTRRQGGSCPRGCRITEQEARRRPRPPRARARAAPRPGAPRRRRCWCAASRPFAQALEGRTAPAPSRRPAPPRPPSTRPIPPPPRRRTRSGQLDSPDSFTRPPPQLAQAARPGAEEADTGAPGHHPPLGARTRRATLLRVGRRIAPAARERFSAAASAAAQMPVPWRQRDARPSAVAHPAAPHAAHEPHLF